MQLKRELCRTIANWLLIPVVLSAGCSTGVQPNAPVPEDAPAQLESIGVVIGTSAPEIQAPTAPGKAVAAIAGAAAGLGIGALSGAGCFLSYGILAQLCVVGLATPVLMVVGATKAVDQSVPETVEWQAERVLKDMLEQKNFQKTLSDHVMHVGKKDSSRRLVTVDEHGLKTLDAEVDYRHLAIQGIDTVLEATPLKVAFGMGKKSDADWETDQVEDEEESGGENVLFSLSMSARARLIRVSDNEILAARTCTFESASYRWADWVEAEGCTEESGPCVLKQSQHFRDQVENGYRNLAEQVFSLVGGNEEG